MADNEEPRKSSTTLVLKPDLFNYDKIRISFKFQTFSSYFIIPILLSIYNTKTTKVISSLQNLPTKRNLADQINIMLD